MAISKKNLEQYHIWFKKGAWIKKQVDRLLEKGSITQAEYDYIIGGESNE